MQSFTLIVFLFVSLCCMSLSLSSLYNGELVSLHVLYRHGDRSPIETFPKDPFRESAWPDGFSQLTKIGMRQHYELGRFLRDRYIEGNPYQFLSHNYSRHEVHIRSTDVDRTLMSAYSNLAGFYPPSGDQIWNSNISWQPIPVHTRPWDDDYMLNMEANCPQYDEEFTKVLNSEWVREFERQNKEFYAFIKDMTGQETVDITTVGDVADPLLCEKVHGFTLPNWTNQVWDGQTTYDKLHNMHSKFFDLQLNQPKLKRLRGGALLQEVVKHLESEIEDRSHTSAENLKCHIYSAHDDTVAALTSAMNVFNGIAPTYASTVMIELIRKDDQFFVQILYRNNSARDPYVLTVPGCQEVCPWEKFHSLVRDNIVTDWFEACHLRDSMKHGGAFFAVYILIIALVSCILLSTIFVVRLRKIKKGPEYERLLKPTGMSTEHYNYCT